MCIRDSPIAIREALEERGIVNGQVADPENQMEIDKAIQNLCKGKTVIVVAHRLSALKMCERVAAVSYTHLDVYKRQTPAQPLQQLDFERKAVPAPVGD